MQQMGLYKGCMLCEFKLVLDQMLWGPDWSLVFVRISPVFRLFKGMCHPQLIQTLKCLD